MGWVVGFLLMVCGSFLCPLEYYYLHRSTCAYSLLVSMWMMDSQG